MTQPTPSPLDYLTPLTPDTLTGNALEDAFSAMISGLSGIDNSLVSVAYQPEVPQQPDPTVDWVSFTVTTALVAQRAVLVNIPGTAPGDGGSQAVEQQEAVDVLASFYGPNAQLTASMVRDGLMIEQNRRALRALGLGLRELGEAVSVPELSDRTNQRAQRRWDLPLGYTRNITRTYNVDDVATPPQVVILGKS